MNKDATYKGIVIKPGKIRIRKAWNILNTSARRFQAFVAGQPATDVVVSRLKAKEGTGHAAATG